MRTLENLMNRLSDMDSSWWPFLHLRPATDQLIDNSLLLKISIYNGPVYGGILSFILVLPEIQDLSLLDVAANAIFYTALFPVLFFVTYKYTFALFWNRRARCLQDQVQE
ncbi:MAG: hypothetical protein WC208_08815 [Gallionella sp.]|jgi:hypothetical protein